MRGRPCPRYLFEEVDTLAHRLASSGRVFLFLDYDGTISPIPRRRIKLERPLSSDMRELLKRLSSLDRVVVSIVSGRSVDVLKRLVGLDSIYYVGVHGHVVEGPGMRFTHCIAESLSSVIRIAASEISKEATPLGAVVEDKEISFTVHYRGVGKKGVEEIKKMLRSLEARYPGIVVRRGRSTFEVLPNSGWDKGRAVAYMISALSMARGSGLPVYFGDDYTDESAFKTVNLARGVSVRVGLRCRTNAQYYVNGVEEVRRFLGMVGDLIGGSAGGSRS